MSNKVYKIVNTINSEENCVIKVNKEKFLPILTLTPKFIENSLIQTTDIVIEDIINNVVDTNIAKTNLTYICKSLNSQGFNNVIFFDSLTNQLVNLPMIEDIDADDFIRKTLVSDIVIYDSIRYTDKYVSNLTFPETQVENDIIVAKSLIGKTIKRITLDITGLGMANLSDQLNTAVGPTKQLRHDVKVLDVLAIKTADINWSGLDIPKLWTIINNSDKSKELTYVGSVNKDVIYIPLG